VGAGHALIAVIKQQPDVAAYVLLLAATDTSVAGADPVELLVLDCDEIGLLAPGCPGVSSSSLKLQLQAAAQHVTHTWQQLQSQHANAARVGQQQHAKEELISGSPSEQGSRLRSASPSAAQALAKRYGAAHDFSASAGMTPVRWAVVRRPTRQQHLAHDP